ncbi:uncharacterized protein UMAG_11835 [Mycosarcoma maydis]|uniref:Uncharacterized protein n=1 Tax=Mycosarcoma maydis TaxID=5270 RepID=A0A0D1EDS4_MYCMD|nr:uncharacterized protein UMAG_11835 [Ustilago maydis 521]KIS72345.1 hypothetical protein UMAG_11835 [Ustilago maydis 521]|eukprot:XP_011386820.1 hypothetical protein UMAG_11835 [Ustilago maydis 521]
MLLNCRDIFGDLQSSPRPVCLEQPTGFAGCSALSLRRFTPCMSLADALLTCGTLRFKVPSPTLPNFVPPWALVQIILSSPLFPCPPLCFRLSDLNSVRFPL